NAVSYFRAFSLPLTATTDICTLSLHDALPIFAPGRPGRDQGELRGGYGEHSGLGRRAAPRHLVRTRAAARAQPHLPGPDGQRQAGAFDRLDRVPGGVLTGLCEADGARRTGRAPRL